MLSALRAAVCGVIVTHELWRPKCDASSGPGNKHCVCSAVSSTCSHAFSAQRRVSLLYIARSLCLRGLLGMGRKAHGRVNNWQQQWVRAAVQQMPRRRFQQTSKLAARSVPHRKELHEAQGMSRTGLAQPSPRHCHACARCPAPCTRAHACTARSTRTLHACEPRQRRAHALTQQHALAHAQKHHVVPRVTGHWLTVGRPAAEPSSAQSQRKCTRHLSLLTSHVHHPHAVHATHHHHCHRTAET